MVVFKIRELREAKGITQEALSELSGVSRATIWALESGQDKVTTTKTLIKIAEALGVRLDDLYFSPERLVN